MTKEKFKLLWNTIVELHSPNNPESIIVDECSERLNDALIHAEANDICLSDKVNPNIDPPP